MLNLPGYKKCELGNHRYGSKYVVKKCKDTCHQDEGIERWIALNILVNRMALEVGLAAADVKINWLQHRVSESFCFMDTYVLLVWC